MIGNLTYVLHGIMLMFFLDRGALFLVNTSNEQSPVRAKKLAGVMFMVLAMQSLAWILGVGVYSRMFSFMFNLMVVPFAVLFLMELSYYRKVSLNYALSHIVPFAIAFALWIILDSTGSITLSRYFFYFVVASILVYSAFYLFVLIVQINRYSKNINDYYSGADSYSIKWVYKLVMIFVIVYALFFILNTIWNSPLARNFYYFVELYFWSFLSHKLIFLKNAVKMEESNSNVEDDEDSANFVQPDREDFLKQLNVICFENGLFRRIDLTRDDVVREMCTNRTYFSRKLNEYTGMNFSAYINDLRLTEAARLLKESDEKIDQIYAQCGFNNKSTFYRTFQKKYNCTPTNYRSNSAI